MLQVVEAQKAAKLLLCVNQYTGCSFTCSFLFNVKMLKAFRLILIAQHMDSTFFDLELTEPLLSKQKT